MSNQYVMIYNLCCLIFIWPIYLIFTYLFVNFIFIYLLAILFLVILEKYRYL